MAAIGTILDVIAAEVVIEEDQQAVVDGHDIDAAQGIGPRLAGPIVVADVEADVEPVAAVGVGIVNVVDSWTNRDWLDRCKRGQRPRLRGSPTAGR